jgi:hypothetical protein
VEPSKRGEHECAAGFPFIGDISRSGGDTGTNAPIVDRFGPSTLIEAGVEKLVFDCGRGCSIRLQQKGVRLGDVKLSLRPTCGSAYRAYSGQSRIQGRGQPRSLLMRNFFRVKSLPLFFGPGGPGLKKAIPLGRGAHGNSA